MMMISTILWLHQKQMEISWIVVVCTMLVCMGMYACIRVMWYYVCVIASIGLFKNLFSLLGKCCVAHYDSSKETIRCDECSYWFLLSTIRLNDVVLVRSTGKLLIVCCTYHLNNFEGKDQDKVDLQSHKNYICLKPDEKTSRWRQSIHRTEHVRDR